MRNAVWGLWLVPALMSAGCSLSAEFGDFSFQQVEKDAGTDDGSGGGGRDGGGNGSDRDGGGSGGQRDGGNGGDRDGGMTEADAGPPPDPVCEAAKETCDPVAQCSSATGKAVCTCPRGYYDANGDGTDCIDLDECRAGIAECESNATCMNKPGGYDCNCNAGFVKNASTGECLDSCVVLLSTTCDANVGICTKPEGEATCRCPAGYIDVNGDGSVCADDTVCMDLKCDPLALCDSTATTPTCTCPSGFTGDGKTCTDVNECTQDPGRCGAGAVCNNTAGGFGCSCLSGYTKSGDTCVDDNECTLGTATCSRFASCSNKPGGFDCACNEGYTGDGRTCVNKNECALGDPCSTGTKNTVCADRDPGADGKAYECSCKSGYEGNPATGCTDVDECKNNPCAAGKRCNNIAGGYTCGDCPPGYQPDAAGTSCVNINECTAGLATCNVNATCADTQGSYTCTCKSGYRDPNVGTATQGRTCNQIDECAENTDQCSDNATCTDAPGTYTCACKAGFTGNGMTCTDINECASSTTNTCHTYATCSNTPPGSYTCACNTGFTDGNPSNPGRSCSDVNECALNKDNCDTLTSYLWTDPMKKNDVCDNTPGSFTCSCPAGYAGTGVGVSGCCTPDNSSDSASPNDGKDNECDGLTDRPVIVAGSTFPEAGGATAAADVSIGLVASVIGGAQVECRAFKRSATSLPDFATCANPVRPSIPTASTADGAWRVEMRWRFSNAQGSYRSHVTSHDFYVHSSLNGATKCPALGPTDEQLFKFADSQLAASQVGSGHTDPGNFASDTFLANPFVSIGYRPLSLKQFTLRGAAVNVTTGSSYVADILSLRHRFVSNGRYVLIRRAYSSRRAQNQGHPGTCAAADFETSVSNWLKNPSGVWAERYRAHSCDVVVLNRAGAGACINVSKGVMSFGPARAPLSIGYSASHKYMWRELLEERRHSDTTTSGFRNFSPKCVTAGCATAGNGNLYLPDRAILRP